MRDLKNTDFLVKPIIDAFPDVKGIYLFGSYGTKFERPDSDIDIAVLAEKKIKAQELWDIAQKIARLLHRNVDLVDLSQSSTVFAFQITHEGKRIFCSKPFDCDLYETHVFSDYVRLNEERREILDDIKKRGRIYNE